MYIEELLPALLFLLDTALLPADLLLAREPGSPIYMTLYRHGYYTLLMHDLCMHGPMEVHQVEMNCLSLPCFAIQPMSTELPWS